MVALFTPAEAETYLHTSKVKFKCKWIWTVWWAPSESLELLSMHNVIIVLAWLAIRRSRVRYPALLDLSKLHNHAVVLRSVSRSPQSQYYSLPYRLLFCASESKCSTKWPTFLCILSDDCSSPSIWYHWMVETSHVLWLHAFVFLVHLWYSDDDVTIVIDSTWPCR